MLVMDFDFVEQGIANGLPERESWRAAFAMTVSLVWIYTNLLRLLAIFSNDYAARAPGYGPGPLASAGHGARSVLGRRGRLGASRGWVAAAVPQLDPQAAHAAAGAGDLGAAQLGAGVVDGRTAAVGDRQHALAAQRLGPGLLVGDQAERGHRAGQQHGGQRAVAVGRGVELVGAEEQRRGGRELGAEDRAQRDRAALLLDAPRSSGRPPAGATRCARPA